MNSALASLGPYLAGQEAAVQVHSQAGLPQQARTAAGLCAYTWEAGELVRINEPDGTRIDYGYGEDGRLLQVLRNGVPWARYQYAETGQLCAEQRGSLSLLHDHDAQGQLVRTCRGDASPRTYTWQAGRVVQARCDAETSHFDCDPSGRLVGLTQTVDALPLSWDSSFDEHGRLAGLHFKPWRQSLGFEWDARGRPTAVSWNGQVVVRLGSDDVQRLSWLEGPGGLRSQTWSEAASGRPVRQCFSLNGEVLQDIRLQRDPAFRLQREGARQYGYDDTGRLVHAADGEQAWRYRYDAADNVSSDADQHQALFDAAGCVQQVNTPAGERVFRHNAAGELESVLVDGQCVARFQYDHKGRLLTKTTDAGTERCLYGADDGLLAVADGQGAPRLIFLRLPTGVVGVIDFRQDPAGRAVALLSDTAGNLVYAGAEGAALIGPLRYDPWGLPLQADAGLPALFRGRVWHAEVGLYRIGCRWYCPLLRRFLTPDSHTGAPDDARLVSPFVPAAQQRMARAALLADWLRQPRLRCGHAYCLNDPINRFDPNGHWSFGGVLLSLLGVLWTLPNTAVGLALEVSCLVGEVLRWLVYAFTLGHVSWQTPGFDVAASGRLNAFALVFKGGWLGSFESLLGITFGNVIFVNGEYQNHRDFKALPDPVSPPAYGGTVTIPKAQALYEHELRHVNQYGWWGPFFHLGLPLFGVYEWDVILNGYQDAELEKDARDHSGF